MRRTALILTPTIPPDATRHAGKEQLLNVIANAIAAIVIGVAAKQSFFTNEIELHGGMAFVCNAILF
jgi:hypothetical protein